MPKVKAAIVGAGLIAGKKHIPAFMRHKNKVELAALCDLNQEGARKLAAEFGVPKVYSDLGEMIEVLRARTALVRDDVADQEMRAVILRVGDVEDAFDHERAHADGVPVIENDDANRAARTVADLVLDAADRSREAR